MNVYQRVLAIRKDLGYIRKDKRVGEAGGYMAVTHDNVTSETRDLFIKHGVVITPPSLLSSAVVLTGTQTSRGIPFIRYEAKYKFFAVNADDPADKFDFDIEAHAIDQGDKAPGKALSYSKKYAVLKLLEIESGEEEEDRQDQHKPKITAAQATRDAFDSLTKDRQSIILDTATQVVDYLNEGKDFDAYGLCESLTDPEEKIALWSRLDSKQRSRLKAQAAKEKTPNG